MSEYMTELPVKISELNSYQTVMINNIPHQQEVSATAIQCPKCNNIIQQYNAKRFDVMRIIGKQLPKDKLTSYCINCGQKLRYTFADIIDLEDSEFKIKDNNQ